MTSFLSIDGVFILYSHQLYLEALDVESKR